MDTKQNKMVATKSSSSQALQSVPMEIDEQQQRQSEIKTEKKKKCHGNRKLHHFKRKCRSRGMTDVQIAELINTRNSNNDNQVNTYVNNPNVSNKHPIKKQNRNKKPSLKRKRSGQNNEEHNQIIGSMSQLSISNQQSVKKRLKGNEEENSVTTTLVNHNPM
jgi:hypothetical protein